MKDAPTGGGKNQNTLTILDYTSLSVIENCCPKLTAFASDNSSLRSHDIHALKAELEACKASSQIKLLHLKSALDILSSTSADKITVVEESVRPLVVATSSTSGAVASSGKNKVAAEKLELPQPTLESPSRLLASEAVDNFWNRVELFTPPIEQKHVDLLKDFIAHSYSDLLNKADHGNATCRSGVTHCDDGEDYLGPLTLRLVCSLLEDSQVSLLNELDAYSSCGVSIAEATPSLLAKKLNLTNPDIFEKRLKKQLIKQGILDNEYREEESHSKESRKKLHVENFKRVQLLLSLAEDQRQRDDLSAAMQSLDTKIIDTYTRLKSAKQRKKGGGSIKRERDALHNLISQWKDLSNQYSALAVPKPK